MAMTILKYRVTFTTPAFLGNAEQCGQWRTPPFKALLRQWWRVAYAANRGFRVHVAEMREAEGKLFGVAADREGGKSGQSRLRLQLDRWNPGQETKQRWGRKETTQNQKITHPEVQAGPVGPLLYLGYGPLTFQGGTALKANTAIGAGESARLSLAIPEMHAAEIQNAMALIHRFGALGGRSRNGWGSLLIEQEEGPVPAAVPLTCYLRRWKDALELDWPHAMGEDERGPLIWQTPGFCDWETAMGQLARIRMGLRTQFVFHQRVPDDRHWLSYPVTHHRVNQWGQGRLPNSLRFKIQITDGGEFRGLIYHVPCRPPEEPFQPDRKELQTVWSQVHRLLDHLSSGAAARTYPTITDAGRRAKLKPELDQTGLERVTL